MGETCKNKVYRKNEFPLKIIIIIIFFARRDAQNWPSCPTACPGIRKV